MFRAEGRGFSGAHKAAKEVSDFMRLVSGYRGAGKYKCLQEIPEERAELSLRHCGWESGIRKMQYRQDLKSVYVLGFVKSGNGPLKMGGEIYLSLIHI